MLNTSPAHVFALLVSEVFNHALNIPLQAATLFIETALSSVYDMYSSSKTLFLLESHPSVLVLSESQLRPSRTIEGIV
jgi:hypothetical protein